MKKVFVLALLMVACQRQDDSSTTAATATATATVTASAAASVTPLATIDPAPTAASATTTIAATTPRDGGLLDDTRRAELAKQTEQLQLQMLQAFSSGSSMQGVLNSKDLPPVDLATAAGVRDGGRTGDLRLGSGSGAVLRGGPGRGGLAEIGPRDH